MYKRVRFAEPSDQFKNISGLKIHDWKIKVIQTSSPHTEDYLVVRKLPCSLDMIEEEITKNLNVVYNARTEP